VTEEKGEFARKFARRPRCRGHKGVGRVDDSVFCDEGYPLASEGGERGYVTQTNASKASSGGMGAGRGLKTEVFFLDAGWVEVLCMISEV